MPIYEYECTECGHQTEALQKFSDPPLTECEFCKGKLKKVISQNSFHLKGSGWYVTDYANGSKGQASSSEKDKTPAKEKAEKKTKKSASKTSDD